MNTDETHTDMSRSQITPFTMIIEQIITDNHALTVENTLNRQNIPVHVKRQIHWEVTCNSKGIFHQIQASGVLFNDQKEYISPYKKQHGQHSLFVRPKEDLLGLQKMQYLKHHFDIQGISAISSGVLWHFTPSSATPLSVKELIPQILATNILFNPISHECYDYD